MRRARFWIGSLYPPPRYPDGKSAQTIGKKGVAAPPSRQRVRNCVILKGLNAAGIQMIETEGVGCVGEEKNKL